ncbi:helix-turn-helix domain-containing protein [Agathobaculum hominis]
MPKDKNLNVKTPCSNQGADEKHLHIGNACQCQFCDCWQSSPAKNDQEELGIVDHTLPYTQEELSVCLNLHRTTVARILAGFAKKGLVRLGYRKIQVTDMIGLRNELR